jgi:hypothetical protein
MDSTRRYELTFEIRDGYGYACVAGENDSLAISSAYWSEIGKYLADADLRKVLIVEDIREQPPMEDIYCLVTQLGGLGFADVTVAFVDRYSSHQELNDFGVLVATSSGMTAKAFGDEVEALDWLLSQK